MDDLTFHYPLAGIDVTGPVSRQPSRKAGEKYARSCYSGVNVRGQDFLARFRGSSRPGLLKFTDSKPGGITYVIQSLGILVTLGVSPVQPSQQGRIVFVWAAQAGVLYFFPAGGTVWLTPTNTTGNTPPMNASGLFYGAVNILKGWFIDGTNATTYNPDTNTLSAWTASAGTFPVDGSGNKPRLICTWRSRTILAGILGDPATIFASKVGDPTNFDYAPAVPVPPTSAWSTTTGNQGQAGDSVTALIPYTDDLLIVGMEQRIAIFRGDPMAGGQFDLMTTTTGIAWGMAWCMDPLGVVYFFGSRGGVFGFVPGNQPQRISQAVDPFLQDTNMGENAITMAWDERRKELRVYITLLATPQTTTHYVWESDTNSWWQDVRTDTNMNPLCVAVMDGNESQQRVVLEGGFDGWVRYMSGDATDDDGTAFTSSITIGPFLTNLADDVMISELQAVMGAGSADVTFAVYVGPTAEEALVSSPVVTGTWVAGRNYTNLVRRTAHALYVVITSTGRWALESVRVKLGTQGVVRQRGKNT